MFRSLLYLSLVLGLGFIGAWGVLRVFDLEITARSPHVDQSKNTLSAEKVEKPLYSLQSQASNLEKPKESGGKNSLINHLQTLFEQRHYHRVTLYINEHYSSLSSEDLIQIRQIYFDEWLKLESGGAKQDLVRLFTSETNVFNDLDSWLRLGDIAVRTQQWPIAFDAILKASLLQSDSIELSKLQKSLVTLAARVRAKLEGQGDKLSVHEVYDRLYKAHPGYPRFQLEMAYSYLRLERAEDARPLLEQLQYDPELGDVSRDVLSRLDQRFTQRDTSAELAARAPIEATPGIRVPLRRYGTNLVADIGVNRTSVPLLLDTGASITAINIHLASQLGLQPLQESVQLATANGVRQAPLFRVKHLQLGGFTLNNHTVAAIELQYNGAFVGLLGTDVLNKLNDQYSYVIDNELSALIFRRKG